ncbi:hypothetical protein BpHYR1_036997 [Brachionus plicatilis]|uniref:Uncharacterized protein n=1 Tax=Brachionus plicatilis TaxID=10195 RepID=A0A3M7SXT4_BRAPC|nr:hypothetical protein BpHYR1_036997 [Brachionus plicatilis]
MICRETLPEYDQFLQFQWEIISIFFLINAGKKSAKTKSSLLVLKNYHSNELLENNGLTFFLERHNDYKNIKKSRFINYFKNIQGKNLYQMNQRTKIYLFRQKILRS